MDVRDFLDLFNDGELDVQKYFNDYDTWFNVLKKRGLLDEIDPHNASDHEVWQNEYLLWLYDNNKEKYYEWIDKFLDDVDIDFENKKVYWVGDREDLASLFCDGYRGDVSQDTIASILGDGDAFEPYWDTTDNVYRDVIEELDEKNISYLKDIIVKELHGQKLSPETEEMELIAAEQGHNDFWEITPDNVVRIIDDEESMNSLLDDELPDLKSNLYSVHSNAYNSAYESTVYDEIFGELNDYFEGQGEWFTKPHPYKKDTTMYLFKIPINDLEGLVNDYLYNHKGYGNQGTLEYHGSFLGIIKEDKDCLNVRMPDYPDFRTIDKNINSYFQDYI